jgi:hypothetical protein
MERMTSPTMPPRATMPAPAATPSGWATSVKALPTQKPMMTMMTPVQAAGEFPWW